VPTSENIRQELALLIRTMDDLDGL